MENTAHKPGPWIQVRNREYLVRAKNPSPSSKHVVGEVIADTSYSDALSEQERLANARRIVAAVNACEGISTELLERMNLYAAVNALCGLVDAINEDESTQEHDLDSHDAETCALCNAREVRRALYPKVA